MLRCEVTAAFSLWGHTSSQRSSPQVAFVRSTFTVLLVLEKSHPRDTCLASPMSRPAPARISRSSGKREMPLGLQASLWLRQGWLCFLAKALGANSLDLGGLRPLFLHPSLGCLLSLLLSLTDLSRYWNYYEILLISGQTMGPSNCLYLKENVKEVPKASRHISFYPHSCGLMITCQ